MFCLDTPAVDRLEGVTRFSGWYVPEDTSVASPKFQVWINGSPVAALRYGSTRSDAAEAYPWVNERALSSGFFGDVVISPGAIANERLFVSILDVAKKDSHVVLYGKHFILSSVVDLRTVKRRTTFELEDLLRCPGCYSPVYLANEGGCCPVCRAPVFVIDGTPHILSDGEAPLIRLSESTYTHPYGDKVLKLLDDLGTATILDFGAGNTPPAMQRPNVCYLDIQQYPATDVVSTRERLPFCDGVFDAVVSQAVFEHLPDPIGIAGEFFRVLKSGGLVYVDTAFLQPLHGDPEHFFNMSRNGIRRVMFQFFEIETGIAPYQYPSYGLRMQLESVLPHMAAGVWRSRLDELYRELQVDGGGLDEALGPRGAERLAAGFYYLGYKR